MKKLFAYLLCVSTLLFLTSCSLLSLIKGKPYKEEAGVYELYYMSGDLNMSMYDYYRITLEADGDCLVESKGKYNSSIYSAEATFEIEDNKIYIVTKSGSASVTEVYDYVDGEIQMNNQSIQGITFTAWFKRNIEE